MSTSELTKKQKRLLKTAFYLASLHPRNARASVCAIVARKGKVVSYGFNKMNTHPLQAKYSKNPKSIFIHAEIDAIRNALFKYSSGELTECEIYIARAKLNEPGGKPVPAMACPCVGCQKAIGAFELKGVFYTEDNDARIHEDN